MERIELSCHTTMSRLDGIITPRELVKTAWAQGCRAVAVTDYNSVHAFPEAELALKRLRDWEGDADFKIIYGLEAKLTDGTLIHLLARSQEGLEAIYRLVEQLDQRGSLRKESIARRRGGLLVGCPGEDSELTRAILDGESMERLCEIASFYDYLEVLPPECLRPLPASERFPNNGIFEMEDIVETVCAVGKAEGKPVAAVGNARFMSPEDNDAYDVLKGQDCLPLRWRSTEDMLAAFPFLDDTAVHGIVVDAPNNLAELCGDVRIIPDKPIFPVLPDAFQTLETLCRKRLGELYGDNIPQTSKERLEEELSCLRGRDAACSVFLIVRHLVHALGKKGYLIGSRGCAAASYIAFLLEITDIDPIAYELPWESFFGADGGRFPDIDLNISGDYWEDAAAALKELFPHELVLPGCVRTLRFRSAAKKTHAYTTSRGLEWDDDKYGRIVDQLSLVKRDFYTRSGCIVIAPALDSLRKIAPVSRNRVLTEYHYFDEVILKLDLLPGTMWSLLSEMEKLTGAMAAAIDPVSTLPLPVDTEDIPEFGSPTLRRMLDLAKPSTLDEFIRVDALAHSTGGWDDNAETLIRDGNAAISEVIGTREDIYFRLLKAGLDRDFAFKVMESVRKGKGLREEWVPVLLDAGIPQWFADSCNKIAYLFPKAHAATYTVAALRAAWFKANYPKEYSKVFDEYFA